MARIWSHRPHRPLSRGSRNRPAAESLAARHRRQNGAQIDRFRADAEQTGEEHQWLDSDGKPRDCPACHGQRLRPEALRKQGEVISDLESLLDILLERRSVETAGSRARERVLVTHGLAVGDTVVRSAQGELAPGQSVKTE